MCGRNGQRTRLHELTLPYQFRFSTPERPNSDHACGDVRPVSQLIHITVQRGARARGSTARVRARAREGGNEGAGRLLQGTPWLRLS